MKTIHISMPLFQRIEYNFVLDLEVPLKKDSTVLESVKTFICCWRFLVVQLVTFFFSFFATWAGLLLCCTFAKAHHYVT